METKSYLCAFNVNDQHLPVDPIVLGCGHSICRDCIFDKNIYEVACGICGQVFIFDENKIEDVKATKTDLNDAFGFLKNKFQNTLDSLKECVSQKSVELERDIKYARDEVEIKVESLKLELDRLKEEIYAKLDEYGKQLNEKKEYLRRQNYERLNFEIHSVTNNVDDGAMKMKTYSKALRKLQNDLKIFETSYQLQFNIDETPLVSDAIASVNLLNDAKKGKITRESLKDYTIYEFDLDPSTACVLPGTSNVAYSSINFDGIRVMDSEFNVLREISEIGDMILVDRIRGMISNDLDRIYICLGLTLIMTDTEFNFIKQYKPIDNGSSRPPFFFGIHYYDGLIYVADDDSHILKLNTELDLCEEYANETFNLKVSGALAMSAFRSKVFFHHLNDFKLKFMYKFPESKSYFTHKLITANGYFYAFDDVEWNLYCFDRDGLFLDIVSLKAGGDGGMIERDADLGAVCFYNHIAKTLTFNLKKQRIVVYKLRESF